MDALLDVVAVANSCAAKRGAGTRLRDATAERMLAGHLATLLNCSQLDTSDDPAKPNGPASRRTLQ